VGTPSGAEAVEFDPAVPALDAVKTGAFAVVVDAGDALQAGPDQRVAVGVTHVASPEIHLLGKSVGQVADESAQARVWCIDDKKKAGGTRLPPHKVGQ
jgi:hypothetical protein